MKNEPLVAVVVVGWNSRRDIDDCMYSLRQQTYRNIRVIFVDNNSSDDSVDFVRINYPAVDVIASPQNLYFGGGNNLAIRYAINELNADYVCLLNPDAAGEPTWIEKHVAEMEQNKSIGLISPIVFFWQKFLRVKFVTPDQQNVVVKNIAFDGTSYRKIITVEPGWQDQWMVDSSDNWIIKSNIPAKLPVTLKSTKLSFELAKTPKRPIDILISINNQEQIVTLANDVNYTVFLEPRTLEQAKYVINSAGTEFDGLGMPQDIGFGDFDGSDYRKSRFVSGVTGVAMMFRRQALLDAGGFDIDYLMYLEESELCARVSAAGWLLVFSPSAEVYHKHMQSTSQAGINRYHYWSTKHSVLFAWQYYNWRRALRVLYVNRSGLHKLQVIKILFGVTALILKRKLSRKHIAALNLN